MVPPTSPSRGTPGRGLGNGSKLGERPAKRIRVQESRSSSNTDQEEELLIPIKRAGRTYGKAKKVTKDFKATATTLESTGPAHRSTTRTYGKASETISPRIHLTRKRIATTFTRSPTGPIDKVIAPGSTITPPLPMEEDSDNDEVVKQSLLGRRSAKKLAAADIYPSPSATPTRKLPAKQEKAGCRPTKGKKKMIIVSVEEEEEEKDEEIMEESSEVHEENTELEDAVEESEKLEQILEEASAEDSEEEYEAVEEEEESDDELDIRPPPSTSSTKSKNTPTKTTTPKKKSQSTTSPLRTPTTHRQDSESTTSRGSSNRIRSLPAAPIILTSQHQNLKAVLVAYHNDDGKLADGTDKDWDDDGEIIISPTKMRKDSFISTTHHSKSLFNELLQQLGQKLFSAHETLPEPEIPVEGFDENLIQDYPTLEGLEKWEKEVRYAIGGVVERGVGNCVVLLGPRGVGKSLVGQILNFFPFLLLTILSLRLWKGQ